LKSLDTIKHRKDIDGLRGLAIIVVLLFHYKFDIFQGGFVGVDIFFVISGFLITGFIASSITDNLFSFINFYIRRARRLLPSYVIILLFCLIVSFFLLPPREFIHFNKSLSFAIAFASNIFFVDDTSYFGLNSHFKPLLHTWSLGVEAQFYLIWPIILLALLKLKFFGRYLIASIIFFGSIGLAIFFGKSVSGYYIPVFRFYEFMLGALVFFGSSRSIKNEILNSILFVVALFLIAISVFKFDSQLAYPSYFAIIPCIGTALVIYTFQKILPSLKLLINNPLLVQVGLISYPLYLIHWPLLVFYQYQVFRPISLADKGILIFLSILISWILYQFIEIPIRDKIHINKKTIKFNSQFFKHIIISTIAIYIVIMPFLAFKASEGDGWSWRLKSTYSEKMAKQLINSNVKQGDHTSSYNSNVNKINDSSKQNILIIGDSHAADIFGALTLNYPASKGVIYHRVNSIHECFLNDHTGYKIEKCKNARNKIQSFNDSYPDGIYMIIYAWKKFPSEVYSPTIKFLKEISMNKIIIFGANQLPIDPVPFIVAKGPQLETNNLLYELIERQKLISYNSIIKTAKELEVNYYDILLKVCNDKARSCEVLNSSNELLYRDDNHWTFEGWEFYGSLMSDILISPQLK
jgi:peptidoglycan/LPS O-acetylase OafA/YrhL